MSQVAGKEGAVTFGLDLNFQLDLDEWSVDDKADIIMTKSFRQFGKTAADGAFVDTVIAFKGYFSQGTADDHPVTDVGLKDGEVLEELCLYITQVDGFPRQGLFFYFPEILVLTAKCMTKTEGRVDIDCTFVPTEDFYWPGDTIPA